jgi:threonine aldolase
MNKIDLRSDTVTLPTTDMLGAMTSAQFGDDVLACSDKGLLGGEYGPHLVRFVTHHGISPTDIRQALVICRNTLRS